MPEYSVYDKNTFRIIDANLNRLGEGLRALEDIARFKLNREALSSELKKLRHQAEGIVREHKLALLDARNSSGDVGLNTFDKYPIADFQSFTVANARRAEQSCRVLEDLFKIEPQFIDSAIFKKTRFSIYTAEKQMISALTRMDIRQQVKGLYVILTPDICIKYSPRETAEQVLEAGVRLIQFREKCKPVAQVAELASEIKDLCHKYKALFIVNDSLELALISGADGLHLGQDDLPIGIARDYLPLSTLIGISVSSVDEARAAEDSGADYVAAGAIFETTSKSDTCCIGLEILTSIRKAVTLPLVAIGGINNDNIGQIVRSGADSVAVISCVLKSGSPYDSAKQLIGLFNNN